MGPIWNDLLYPPPDPGARAAGGVGADLGVAGAARAADQRAEVLEAEDGAPVEQEVARAHEDHAHQVHQVKLRGTDITNTGSSVRVSGAGYSGYVPHRDDHVETGQWTQKIISHRLEDATELKRSVLWNKIHWQSERLYLYL